jgi:hypothetical protein
MEPQTLALAEIHEGAEITGARFLGSNTNPAWSVADRAISWVPALPISCSRTTARPIAG